MPSTGGHSHAGPGGQRPRCRTAKKITRGYMSRLADNVEAVQLGSAAQLLEQAPETLDDHDAALEEMRRLAKELTGALRDVLRVATSRGHLLAVSEPCEPAH
ncbi:hypothetical protein [[Kitasatospora] papulosa]|uniref:hypothetical protein n=1 Tax=[Kitasatospora] papulosa TaxID=1464011 RepID=UPI0036D15244